MLDYREAVASFWEQAHAENSDTYMTGNTLASHCDCLCVTVEPRSRLLCIGIGNGIWVREAAGIAADVWVLDVVQRAAKKVQDLAHCTLDAASLPKDYFDLAMSLWVAPHMDDADLEYQLRHVIPSLAPDGLLALHYNEPYPEGTDVPIAGKYSDVRITIDGRRKMLRKTFLDLTDRLGGTVQFSRELPSPVHGLSMIVAHVRRKAVG